MADKITGYGKSQVEVATSRSREAGRSSRAGSDRVDAGHRAAEKGATAAADTQVRLTDTATNLKQVEQSLASMPDVDQARVSEIRQRVDGGSYQVNADRLADRLLAFERDLA